MHGKELFIVVVVFVFVFVCAEKVVGGGRRGCGGGAGIVTFARDAAHEIFVCTYSVARLASVVLYWLAVPMCDYKKKKKDVVPVPVGNGLADVVP